MTDLAIKSGSHGNTCNSVAELGDQRGFRSSLQAGGRLHVDRLLPFLVLNRFGTEPFSLARRIAAISPAGLIWPAESAADDEAAANVRSLVQRLLSTYPRFMMISLHDLAIDDTLDDESPRLEEFRFELVASADDAAQSACRSLEASLVDLCIDHRDARVERVDVPAIDPDPLDLSFEIERMSTLSLGIPQIHRVPGEARIYPGIFHELESAVFDALLRCFAEFMAVSTSAAPIHHRALGRGSFIDAALSVDRELSRISASYDFLLGISPINSVQAFENFTSANCQSEPAFRYRPLTVSPDLVKRALYAVEIRAVEDPVLESLFREKQQEIDRQLLMLESRNKPAFRHASLLQYGGVEVALLETARNMLQQIEASNARSNSCLIDCHVVKAAAETLIARYQRTVPGFVVQVELRDDIAPGLMVSGTTLMISTATSMSGSRLDALLQHEVSVHLLTCVNGKAQGLGIFGAGLAGYEGIQEGLGVFAEYAVGGLTRARLRLLAARVVIVHAMLSGADFIECYRLLHKEHDFEMKPAFNIVSRIFRSGGLSKDAIYLRGLIEVFEFIAEGNDLAPFWFGKIARRHVSVVDELRERGMLSLPTAVPEFLELHAAQERIRNVGSGKPFIELLRSSAPC